MMFRWTNKQLRNIKVLKFMRSLSKYDWISPLNHSQAYIYRPTIYSNTTVYAEKLVRLIRSLVSFHLFEALNGALVHGAYFFRASFLHLIKDTDSIYGHAAQIFKSKNIVKQMPLRHYHIANVRFWPERINSASCLHQLREHVVEYFSYLKWYNPQNVLSVYIFIFIFKSSFLERR